ncbi:BTB/POZ protein [Pseudomassariella vexata]|uniref:BTB/POZ protein n=1 Tax=Pseudomassariella vexata TaxID=1141098 RepID=A0A1Y2D9H0_9PEZI|nr:BTB/POZ protein [Pseudomassariella vexata]ORY55912.1 BTB/POZ protein [Pseudomassariella vexata]
MNSPETYHSGVATLSSIASSTSSDLEGYGKQRIRPIVIGTVTTEEEDYHADDINGRVNLQVGEQRFVTTKDTLLQADYFRSLLLSPCSCKRQRDGSYFIDADPELFNHILRYLRRGIRPVFWDLTKGHDYVQYNALLEEARYFGVRELVSWIERQEYHDVVSVETTVLRPRLTYDRATLIGPVGKVVAEGRLVDDTAQHVDVQTHMGEDGKLCRAVAVKKKVKYHGEKCRRP